MITHICKSFEENGVTYFINPNCGCKIRKEDWEKDFKDHRLTIDEIETGDFNSQNQPTLQKEESDLCAKLNSVLAGTNVELTERESLVYENMQWRKRKLKERS